MNHREISKEDEVELVSGMKKTVIEKLKEKGLWGSSKDPYWNKETKRHDCCGSVRSYFHRVGCKICTQPATAIANESGSDIFTYTEKVPNLIRYNKHPLRKNNDLVAAMYALYASGKSLREVGVVYKRTRQAVYDVFRTRGYQLRSPHLHEYRIIDGIKFTSSYEVDGKRYWRSTKEPRELLSHYLWKKHNGLIPEGYGIHYKDGDRHNCVIENLEMLTIAEISSRFSPHYNQFTTPNRTVNPKSSYQIRREKNLWFKEEIVKKDKATPAQHPQEDRYAFLRKTHQAFLQRKSLARQAKENLTTNQTI